MAEPMLEPSASDRSPVPQEQYLDYGRLRKQYLDYCNVKRDEVDEQREARHYYHCDQYTAKQRKAFKKRNQPVVTFNRCGRKIDAIVGLVERLRQDPKVYPRTPQHEDGADIASSSLRYALDREQWGTRSAGSARNGAMVGIGGVEMSLEPGDENDQEPTLAEVDIETFFYDPRSFRPDFSDARFMGVAKWMDVEVAQQMFPDKAQDIAGLMNNAGETDTSAQQDRERKWIDSEQSRVFVVEHWYQHNNEWCWCFYIQGLKLREGQSPFRDEKGKTFCRFIMFSAAVDHDGDRYGFIRNLKSAQDEINARRSKSLHLMHSRRILARRGSLKNIEKTRQEAARPDAVIEWEVEKPEFEDAKSQADLAAQMQMLAEAKSEIDAYGPNPQLVGETRGEKSGRAIALLQQAGIAELGPYIIALKDWKLRVYRAVWNAIKQYWSAERWIRVTDNEGLAQFIKVNTLVPGELGPVLQNALGQVDVDIIIDEGPDNINAMQDAYEILTQGLAQNGVPIPPAVLIKLSQIPSSIKKEILDEFEKAKPQPDPMQQQAQVIALQGEEAKVEETRSKTVKNLADAASKQQEANLAPVQFAAERHDAALDASLRAQQQQQPAY